MVPPFVLTLIDFKTVSAPRSSEPALAAFGGLSETALGVAILVGLFALAWILVVLRSGGTRRAQKVALPAINWILVDGSNVMHWQDNAPQITTVVRVVDDLKRQGFAPGVVFDANAGWKLFGRYLNETELARLLGLPRDQVLVAPKGTPADPYLLRTARDFKARIVTNDRFRDWAGDFPEVTESGFLIRGSLREGQVQLNGLKQAGDSAP